jgi:hypothetical protein
MLTSFVKGEVHVKIPLESPHLANPGDPFPRLQSPFLCDPASVIRTILPGTACVSLFFLP